MASARDPYEPAEMPRRDVVPPSGFSRPSDFTADPEATALIPSFRARRRRIALRITAAMVAVLGAAALGLAYVTLGAPLEERKYATIPFLALVVATVVAALAVRALWKWALAPDPADRVRRI